MCRDRDLTLSLTSATMAVLCGLRKYVLMLFPLLYWALSCRVKHGIYCSWKRFGHMFISLLQFVEACLHCLGYISPSFFFFFAHTDSSLWLPMPECACRLYYEAQIMFINQIFYLSINRCWSYFLTILSNKFMNRGVCVSHQAVYPNCHSHISFPPRYEKQMRYNHNRISSGSSYYLTIFQKIQLCSPPH